MSLTVDQFVAQLEDLKSGITPDSPDSFFITAASRVTDALNAAIGTSAKFSWQLVGDQVILTVEPYVLYQNYGVRGSDSQKQGVFADDTGAAPYTHAFGTNSKNPHSSLFARYTDNKGEQFAIAKSIKLYGIPGKRWFSMNSGVGYQVEAGFAEQLLAAIREQII